MSPFSLWAMALQRHALYALFLQKKFRAEVRNKQAYDMVAVY